MRHATPKSSTLRPPRRVGGFLAVAPGAAGPFLSTPLCGTTTMELQSSHAKKPEGATAMQAIYAPLTPSRAYARLMALSTLLEDRLDRERAREAVVVLADAALTVAESEAA